MIRYNIYENNLSIVQAKPENMRKENRLLWILFLVMLFIRIAVTMDYWILLILISASLSIMLLRKNGLPSKKYKILAIVFALLASIAYLGYQRDPLILIYGIFRAGIITLVSSAAVFSVMEKRGGFRLIRDEDRHSAICSIGIGVLTGAVLSVINIFISGETVSFRFSLWNILLSLNPAIYEEMACRAIFMAFCVYAASGEKMSTADSFTMYFMMCVPHTIVHGYGAAETLILCAVFGLPFALLQRKRDIASAMISHGIVDAVRFTLIGF